jgi:hypothetical protein
VWGVWFDGNLLNRNTITGDNPQVPRNPTIATEYLRDFDVDTTFGMVRFNEAVYRISGDGATTKFKPAILKLRCVFSIKDFKTRAWSRFQMKRKLADGVADAPPRYIVREDIVLNTYPVGGAGGKPSSNRDFCQQMANYYLDAAEQEYQQTDPASATYAGLRDDFELDGAIQSITYSVGLGGATTSVSRNDERTNPAMVLYRVRRQMEAAVAREKKAKAADQGLFILAKK